MLLAALSMVPHQEIRDAVANHATSAAMRAMLTRMRRIRITVHRQSTEQTSAPHSRSAFS